MSAGVAFDDVVAIHADTVGLTRTIRPSSQAIEKFTLFSLSQKS
jgi:hypothetical protein